MWNKAEGNPPPSVGDCRKLVVLVDKDGMTWIGIRAYHHAEGYWVVGSLREESANVTHWMDLPEMPKNKIKRGDLVRCIDDCGGRKIFEGRF